MSPSLIVVLLLIVIIALFAVYRIFKVKAKRKKINEERFSRLMLIYKKLEAGDELSTAEVAPFAEDLRTRCDTFQLLKPHNQLALFPQEYLNLIKGAEGALANWLEFPTELDACPDEMQHIKRVTIDFDGQNNFVHYEVFQYSVNEPHWAAKDGWILGVVGPFFEDSKPYDHARSTFSRVSSTVGTVTPEEEVKWVHENISMRR